MLQNVVVIDTTNLPTQPLKALGFSEIESLVYAYLVGREPTTGYRVSHAIGKPTANTYKAIASLQQAGAVLVDEGDNRLVRAVRPSELLDQLERRFRRRRERAAEALENLSRDESAEGVYTLKAVDQVLERARSMLRRAERIVLLDVFPAPFAQLAPDLQAAAERGVRVVAKVYEPVSVSGLEAVVEPEPERIFELWPGQQLTLVRDAEEHLIGLLADDLASVLQAVWSDSLYLSCMHHNHVASEIAARARVPSADAQPIPEQITLLESNPPGLSKLVSRTSRDG